MALRYPNRTGEVGTFNTGGAVTLSGTTALPGMRTFDDAISAGKLFSGDNLGITIKKVGDESIWAVWIVEYEIAPPFAVGITGTLIRVTNEDSSGTFADGDTVEVFATLTALMLDSAGLTLP